jgi:hypothetical protein
VVLRDLVCKEGDLPGVSALPVVLSAKVVGAHIVPVVLEQRVKHVQRKTAMVVQNEKGDTVSIIRHHSDILSPLFFTRSELARS